MVVQKNAASAEESAAAAQEMNAQAVTMKGFVGELMALVGGSGNGSGNPSVKIVEPKEENSGGLRKILPAFAKNENEKTKAPATKSAAPEKVIPMGEGDFKEF